MADDLLEWFVDASLRRWRANARTARHEVDGPGLHGLIDSRDRRDVTLLVLDDRSFTGLAEIVAEAQTGMIQVLCAAERSLALLHSSPAWIGSPQTAMVYRQLSSAPQLPVPEPFVVAPVRRVPAEPADGVPLARAVATAIEASPGEDPTSLTAYLSTAAATHLFAALDPSGAVCATAGYQLTESHARVILINTAPAWRRRGLGIAMTAHAIADARSRGATEASLDATDLGRPVYQRLGFDTVGPTVRFLASGATG